MKKHCESEKRFGKEDGGTEARNEILESFIRDSGQKAYQVAYSHSGNCEDANELVQDALYRVARAWDKYEVSKPLDAWFFTILRNAFMDSRKRFERRNGVSLDRPLDEDGGGSYADLLADSAESIPQSLERKETVNTVRRALEGMRRQERAVLKLCDMDGRTYDDIARSLGVPAGTVRSRIFRARQTLRNQSPELATLVY